MKSWPKNFWMSKVHKFFVYLKKQQNKGCSIPALQQRGHYFAIFDLCVCVEQEEEETNTTSHLKLIVDAFIQQLPNCVNRDLIDKVRQKRK